MKLKYIIASLLAGATLFTACEKEADHYLSEIKVDKSFVAFPKEGGSQTIVVTATDAWSVEISEEDAAWLSASPASGTAGTQNVTLTATAGEDGHETSIKIACAGQKQIINVTQEAGEKQEPAVMSVAEALEIIKPLGEGEVAAGTFRVKGKVCKISEISVQYGNATYYLSDDGTFKGSNKNECNWLQVYRGLWLDSGAFTKGDEFAVGDELVIEGLLMDYKGTPETKEKAAYVVSITKSLINVEDFTFDKLPAIDTTFNLVVSAKESPLLVNSDAEWLQIAGVNADGSYKLHADENLKTAERTANISIQGPTALKSIAITQKGVEATGSSVSEIIAMEDNSMVKTLPSTVVVALTTKGAVLSDGTKAIYAYGDAAAALKVGDGVSMSAKKTTYNGVPELTDITDIFVDSEGNAVEHPNATDITAKAGEYTAAEAEYIKLTGTVSLTLNDDGTPKYVNLALDAFEDGSKQGSINSPVDDLNIKSFDGKKVTVTGYFNGLGSKGKFINIIATKIVEFVDNPKGTATNPYTASEIAALLLNGTTFDEDVYIKGIVSSVLYTASASYPTATFWISDDGTAYGVSEDKKKTTEPTKDFECYSVKWFGNADWAEGNGQVTVGDEVIVCGKTTVYNGVAETSSKKAWLYSVNYVKTAGVGLGSTEFPFNVAGVEEVIDFQQAEIAAATAADAAAPVFKDVCVGGKISAILYDPSASYPTCTFWISDDGTAYGVSEDKKTTTQPTKDFECYSVKWFGNTDWTEGSAKPAVGDNVVVKGQLTLYKGTYETASKKAWIYSLNGATE